MAKMTLKEYREIVAGWEKLYGVPQRVYNPAMLVIHCARCEQQKPLQRHHKAPDFTFAMAWPQYYAERYILYHPEDCEKLCRTCHLNYHEFLKSIGAMVQLHNDLKIHKRFLTKEVEIRKWVDNWRELFHTIYAQWKTLPRGKKKSVKAYWTRGGNNSNRRSGSKPRRSVHSRHRKRKM